MIIYYYFWKAHALQWMWMDGPLFSDYIHFKDFELQVANLNGTKEFNIEWEECNKQVQIKKL